MEMNNMQHRNNVELEQIKQQHNIVLNNYNLEKLGVETKAQIDILNAQNKGTIEIESLKSKNSQEMAKVQGEIDAQQKQLELRGKIIDKIDDTAALLSLVGIDSSKLNLGHTSPPKQQIDNNVSLANSQMAAPAQNVYNNNPQYVTPMNQSQIINQQYQQNQMPSYHIAFPGND